jgi:anti-sigma regulatory factor (Ser/Thr protein kinase)
MSTTYSLRGGLQAPAAARRALIEGQRWDVRRRDDVALLLSEVITNAVLHGGVGPDEELRIDETVGSGMVAYDVYDLGDGFTPPALDAPWRRRGLGLFIVNRLAQRWGVRPAPAGSCVWFEARIDRDPVV